MKRNSAQITLMKLDLLEIADPKTSCYMNMNSKNQMQNRVNQRIQNAGNCTELVLPPQLLINAPQQFTCKKFRYTVFSESCDLHRSKNNAEQPIDKSMGEYMLEHDFKTIYPRALARQHKAKRMLYKEEEFVSAVDLNTRMHTSLTNDDLPHYFAINLCRANAHEMMDYMIAIREVLATNEMLKERLRICCRDKDTADKFSHADLQLDYIYT